MKKIILILDGMADRGQEILGGKTPLEYGDTLILTRFFPELWQHGKNHTRRRGSGKCGGNLNMLGFTSSEIYKGRAVIEAAGAKLPIKAIVFTYAQIL